MEAIKISLDDFVLSGGGFNGESYDHKTENVHHRTRHTMPHAAIPRSVVESLTMMGKKTGLPCLWQPHTYNQMITFSIYQDTPSRLPQGT